MPKILKIFTRKLKCNRDLPITTQKIQMPKVKPPKEEKEK